MRNRVLRLLTALALATAPAGAAEPTSTISSAGSLASASPDRSVTLRYEVSWSLIPLIEIESRTRLDRADYTMVVQIETVGLIDFLFPWRASQEVHGAVFRGTVAPRSFRTQSEFRGRRQEVDLGYGPEGLDRERVEGSTIDPAEREDVPPELRRGTVDPLSAVVAVSQRLIEGGTCAGTARIFDGVRRYDLNYEDLGERDVEEGEVEFGSRARLCRTTMVPIGGFWKPPDREPDSLDRIDSWWASPWPDADPVPVRLSLEGSRGTLDVRLVGASRGPEGSEG